MPVIVNYNSLERKTMREFIIRFCGSGVRAIFAILPYSISEQSCHGQILRVLDPVCFFLDDSPCSLKGALDGIMPMNSMLQWPEEMDDA
jgi:hypothetical protein